MLLILNVIKWILERWKYPDYVYNVRVMEELETTYLPDINGYYGKVGLRTMDQRDIIGRWSLGWRPSL